MLYICQSSKLAGSVLAKMFHLCIMTQNVSTERTSIPAVCGRPFRSCPSSVPPRSRLESMQSSEKACLVGETDDGLSLLSRDFHDDSVRRNNRSFTSERASGPRTLRSSKLRTAAADSFRPIQSGISDISLPSWRGGAAAHLFVTEAERLSLAPVL